MDETRKLVLQLHGRSQLERARPALRSVADRLSYAQIHIQALEVLIETYLSPTRRRQELVKVIFTDSENLWNEFNLFLTKVGAHATACIQSLHAVGDLLSHAIYYSLAIDISEPLEERKITLGTVVGRLKGHSKSHALHHLLVTLGPNGDFKHLAALSNRSKHRSLILPSLNEDRTGRRAERLAVLIENFSHDETNFPSVHAQDFLVAQFEAVGRRTNEVGSELNAILRLAPA